MKEFFDGKILASVLQLKIIFIHRLCNLPEKDIFLKVKQTFVKFNK